MQVASRGERGLSRYNIYRHIFDLGGGRNEAKIRNTDARGPEKKHWKN